MKKLNGRMGQLANVLISQFADSFILLANRLIFKSANFQILAFLPLLLNAQDSVLEPGEKQDSFNYNKVMIIPFDPQMYFSDSDKELADFNNKKVRDIHLMFRQGLEYSTNVRILDRYQTYEIMRDTNDDALLDLKAIYEGISYKYQPSGSVLLAKEEKKKKSFIEKFEEKIKGKNENEKEEENKDARFASRYKENTEETRYLDAMIHSNEMLKYMSGKYGTDLFLFINQFELKTNFENCLDRAALIYEREIKVHFSIYDKNGRHIFGDVVTVIFPSNTNSMDEIIRKNFPLISNYLAGKMPNPKRVSPE